MIVSRTPLRISFFGGGTDYPEYFERARGAVLGMAIDKYIYISALRLTSVLDYKYRISYSKIETVSAISEIQHPVVRAVLDHHGLDQPLDISILADLPARSGLGSSSAFTVGFLNLVGTLRHQTMTKLDLARSAVYIERDVLGENVGVQDQYHAAFGGLNRFDFETGRTRLSPKKRLSSKVSNPAIDTLYDQARAAGALGGKLCGAGNGGFLLMLVPPERHAVFAERMRDSVIIPVGLDTVGSTILTG